jgi:hypothetical protein
MPARKEDLPGTVERSPAKVRRTWETFGGVDIKGNTKAEPHERAKELDVEGRSTMDEEELARGIARYQQRLPD